MSETSQPLLPLGELTDITHRLSDTHEARRLRTMLKAATEAEGAMIGMVEYDWTPHGFHLVVCSPGDEVALSRAVSEAMQGMEMVHGFWAKAALVVLERHGLKAEWEREIKTMHRALKRKAKSDATPP